MKRDTSFEKWHMICFMSDPNSPMDYKCAQIKSDNAFLEGPMVRKHGRHDVTKGRWERKKVAERALLHPFRGLEMPLLGPKCNGMTCKNVLPAEGGKHFFEKVMN